MTERMIVNRIKKLKALEEQQRAISEQIEALKTELQADMTEKGTEEQQAGQWIIRWTRVITNRLDSKALNAEFPEIALRFTKPAESRRFSIV